MDFFEGGKIMKTFGLWIGAACLVILSALPGFSQNNLSKGPDGTNVIMVLDASGSMWGQIDGVPKIQIARDVIGNLLKGWDTSINLGLIAYGHRSKGDCGDIETLVPVGPIEAGAFMEKVNNLNPKGKTPLSAAVKQAAEALKYTEEKATVILISDGLETCDADPCALATKLEADGIDFTTHVVGFDITQEESDKLACLAENTGGRFLRASNADELTSALAETVETMATEPAPKATGPQGIKLRAVLCEKCDPITDNLFWWLLNPERDINGNREEISVSGAASPLFKVDAGDYYVRGRYGDAYVETNVTVKPGELSDITVNFNAGHLKINAVPTQGGDVLNDSLFYWIYGAKKDLEGNRKEISVSGAATPLFRLPAGNYHIVARHGDAFAEADVGVTAGALTEQTMDMNVGYFRVNAVAAQGGDPIENNIFYWVYGAKKDLEGNRKEISVSGAATPLFRLPAGDYHIVSRHGDAYAEADFSITAGELIEKTMIQNSAYLKASAVQNKGGPPLTSDIFWWVYEQKTDLEGNRKEISVSGSSEPLFILPAGDYMLTVRHGGEITNTNVSLTPGESKTLNILVSQP